MEKEVLNWWRTLTLEQKKEVVEKHFSNKSFYFVRCSFTQIQELFLLEKELCNTQ